MEPQFILKYRHFSLFWANWIQQSLLSKVNQISRPLKLRVISFTIIKLETSPYLIKLSIHIFVCLKLQKAKF
jgi:hypothetical protein